MRSSTRARNLIRFEQSQHSFSTSRRSNPYDILGVPTASSFPIVQKAFVQLALEYHPDTTSSTSKRATEDFVRIREAYEEIRRLQPLNFRPVAKEEEPIEPPPAGFQMTEHHFLQYFFQQTGVLLTSNQRRELVSLYRNARTNGGFCGGHSWDLARRLVAEQDAYLRCMQQGGVPPNNGKMGNRVTQAMDRKQEGSSTDKLRRPRRR